MGSHNIAELISEPTKWVNLIFIPQLPEQTQQLRELVKNKSVWDFILSHGVQFDKLFFVIVFFNWDLLHARLNSHYKAWSYKKKKHKKIKAYRKSV